MRCAETIFIECITPRTNRKAITLRITLFFNFSVL
jgi:hypothetical protein